MFDGSACIALAGRHGADVTALQSFLTSHDRRQQSMRHNVMLVREHYPQPRPG